MRPACLLAPYCAYAEDCINQDHCLFLDDLEAMEEEEQKHQRYHKVRGTQKVTYISNVYWPQAQCEIMLADMRYAPETQLKDMLEDEDE